MRVRGAVKKTIKFINHYLIFFVMVAFVTTCCMMLFVSTFSENLGFELTRENMGTAAKYTFLNVALISLIFTVVDKVRRKLTVERPINRITEAAKKIVQGNFTARVKPQSRIGTDESFNQVIDCFNQMAAELGSVETLRTDFIANVSHEMKTPLAVMQNYGTLLQQDGLSDEKRKEYAKGVTEGARRMADMMANILKLNRLENQQIYPKQAEFDLGEQICECLLSYESVWEASNINIETDLEDDIKIKADEELLTLVWNNLFSNAFKFTESGGTVSVSLKTDGDNAVVSVKDTGCGMKPEVGAHIFEKFYQGDTSRATQGNGLGLALVKRVIDIMHGEINVESTYGVGSVFTVRLPRL